MRRLHACWMRRRTRVAARPTTPLVTIHSEWFVFPDNSLTSKREARNQSEAAAHCTRTLHLLGRRSIPGGREVANPAEPAVPFRCHNTTGSAKGVALRILACAHWEMLA